MLAHDDVAALIAGATELHAEVIGRALRDGEEHLVGRKRLTAREREARHRAPLTADAVHGLRAKRDAAHREFVVVAVFFHLRRAAIRGDGHGVAPVTQRHGHPQRAATVADHHDALAARLVAVAVGTHVGVGAVRLLEPRNLGPHVA